MRLWAVHVTIALMRRAYTTISSIFSFIILAASIVAQPICASADDAIKLSAAEFKNLVSKWQQISLKRGEFETTAEAHARVLRAIGTSRYFVDVKASQVSAETKHSAVSYDADRATLQISPTLPDVNEWQFNQEFAVTRSLFKLKVLSESSTTRSYPAQNAFGAKVRVTNIVGPTTHSHS